MIGLQLEHPADRPLSVLALGAHSDDLEIGCGGTILELLEGANADVTWVVFSAAEPRDAEAADSAERLLDAAASSTVVLESFEDTFFPYHGEAVKRRLRDIANDTNPDVVFTHSRDDLHQDHRLLCELTWNAFRDHLILEYEIPKWDGDFGRPNAYSPLSAQTVERKLTHLRTSFPSQTGKPWFTDDVFAGLMRLRGMECNAPSGFAEAFYSRKAVVFP